MNLEERLRRARGSAEELGSVLHDRSDEVLVTVLDNPRLNDDQLGVLLSRKDLRQSFLREFATREKLVRNYAIKLALVRHPHAPRNLALPLLRQLFVFDQLKIAATPSTPAELRRLAEEMVITRLVGLPLGERLTIARQGTSRLAAALLADSHVKVAAQALDNARLTEENILWALRERAIRPETADCIAEHRRWSLRYEVRRALIRCPGTSLRRVLLLINQVRLNDLAVLVEDRNMPADRRRYVARIVEQAAKRPVRRGQKALLPSGARVQAAVAASGSEQMV